MTDARVTILAVLLAAVKDFDFPVVAFSADLPATTGTTARAMSVKGNEVSASFEVDDRYKRGGIRLRRSGWRFMVEADFAREVSLDTFEDAMCDAPLMVASVNPRPAILVRLSDTVYGHPATYGGVGSTAMFTFVATELRR